MTRKEARKHMKRWLEPLNRFAKLPPLENGRYDSGTKFVKAHIPVRGGEYMLAAHIHENGKLPYLGGYWHSSKGGGRDMHDGTFSEETFNRFLADVVAHQIVETPPGESA